MADPSPAGGSFVGTAPEVAAGLVLLLCAAAAVVLSLGQSAVEHLSVRRLAEEPSPAARALRRLFEHYGEERLVLMLAWARIFLYAVLTLLLARRWLAPAGAGWAGLLAYLAAILLCGEAVPRFVGRYNAERILRVLRPFLWALARATAPVGAAFRWLPAAIARLSGVSPEQFEQERLADEISDVAEEGERTGVLEEGEREMIENIMALGDTRVAEVMTPRIDLVMLPADTSPAEARRVAVEAGHSRYPVYEGNRDQVVGILHVKDLLRTDKSAESATVRELVRKPFFVPETMGLLDLLREFRERRVQIAVVLDEYGGTAGLVTLEDILEEIVGEIADEFEAEGGAAAELEQVSENVYRADAKLPIRELNERLHLALPEEAGYETLGGFVFSHLGRVPQPGESFQFNGVEFRVVAADDRRIHRVEIVLAARAAPEGTGDG